MTAAVLLLIFNRPETTRRVFAAIRQARPDRLYIAADGPRAGRPDDAARCSEARTIATSVDWPCQVQTLFRQDNLGCKHGVAAGIDWFFAHEKEGIILEDDVLPQPSFFRFCNELLVRYRDDPTVSMISGCNLLGNSYHMAASYSFTRYMHIWGWASWRRAWSHYDVEMATWPSSESRTRLMRVLGRRENAIYYWSQIFDRVKQGRIDTWDYQWVYAAWMNDMLAVIPSRNLTENLGFGLDATHTTGSMPAVIRIARPSEMDFPLHDQARGDTTGIDVAIERRVMAIDPLMRVRARIGALPVVRAMTSMFRTIRR